MAAEPQPRVPDVDERREWGRIQQIEGQAQSLAGQTGGDATQFFEDEDHWDKLSDFDIERESVPDELGEALATEFSDKYVLGNLPNLHEWEKFGFWAENEIHTLLKEYPDADSAVTGTDYHIMYGQREGLTGEDGRNIKPPLTDEDVRRMWSAADSKRMAMTLAIKARALRALTEITAVGRTETVEKEDDEPGRLQKLLDKL